MICIKPLVGKKQHASCVWKVGEATYCIMAVLHFAQNALFTLLASKPPNGINGMKIIINKNAVAMTTVSHGLLQKFTAEELYAILSIVIVALIKKEY